MICGRVDGGVLGAAEAALQVVLGVVAEFVVTGGVRSIESLLMSMGVAAVEGGVDVNKSRLLLAYGLEEAAGGWLEIEEVVEDCLW